MSTHSNAGNELSAISAIGVPGLPAVETGSELAITADTEIVIAGVGRIVIRPAIKNREATLAQIAKAETALKQSLEEMNVSSTEEADAQLAKRQNIELRLAQAKAQVSQLTPANRGQKLAAGLESLRNHLGSLQGQLKTEMSALKLAVRPELQAAQNEVQLAESAESQAADALAIAQGPIPDLDKQQAQAFRKHSKAEAEVKTAQDEVTRLSQETAHALALESAEALADRLNTARHAYAVRKDEVAQLEQSQLEDTVAGMDARIKRYEQALKNRQEEARSTKERIAVLNSRIEREGGVGLDEQIADKERNYEELLRERTASEGEVKMLILLRNTLCQAELEAKERYMAPVIRRITPYLRRLFPNSAIECDENFQITGFTRDSGKAEEFAQLSDGTKEQVAVLTRLAFADMLKDRAKPAMVILDDALVFSDTERMERMFDILTQAAARTQILILTCRGELFARLGGNRLQVLQ